MEDSQYRFNYTQNNGGQKPNKNVERIPQPHVGRWIAAAVIAVVVLILSSTCCVVTAEDEYTLIKRFGKVERVINEPGLTFKIPFIETEVKLDKEVLIYDLKASDVTTLDKKMMVADSYVLWRITDPRLYVQTLNSRTEAESRLNTTVYNSVKSVISSMNQTDVISGRDGELDKAIQDNIGDSMNRYGIELIKVETKHLDLPNDNKNAVYERMISERNNIAATYTAEGESEAKKIRNATDNEIAIMLSEAEAEAEKTVAEGEAEYMKIIAEAYSDASRSEFYTFVRSLDAAKLMMQGGNKTLVLPADSPIAQIFTTLGNDN